MPTQPPKKEIRKNIPLNANFQKQVIYSFTENDIVEQSDQSIIYRFPYSPHTFWVNFKCACFNQYGHLSNNINLQLVLKTTEEERYVIETYDNDQYYQNKWCHTQWPIPSVKTLYPSQTGLFFHIDFLQPIPNHQIKLYLQGFTELYPDAKQYFLMDHLQKYKYLFMKLYHNPFLTLENQQKESDIILSMEENFEQHTEVLPQPSFDGVLIHPF
jgi:hypothetical protein